MPRMRTSKEVIEEIKAKDPGSRFTRHALQIKALNGEIPFIQVGKKRLFDLDLVERYLSGEFILQQPELETHGKIRRLHG